MIDTKNTIVEYALQNEENLEVAFETHKAFEAICDRLSKKFLYKLKGRLELRLTNDGWIFPDINDSVKITFLIRNRKWTEQTAFGLYDFSDNDRACFAIQTNEENRPGLFAEVQKDFQGRVTGFGWWSRLRDTYSKWDESLEGIKAVFEASDFLDYAESQITDMSKIISDYFERNPEPTHQGIATN